MTLRLVKESDNIWRVRCGDVRIGSVERIAAGHNRDRWSWSIFWLHEPRWNLSGGADTRDEAMHDLGTHFRQWLDFAGLEEGTSRPINAPFQIGEPEKGRDRYPISTPSGLHVGYVEPFWTVPDLVLTPRQRLYAAWITKFHDPTFMRFGCAPRAEAAVGQACEKFRAYLATAGLQERLASHCEIRDTVSILETTG